MKKSVGKCVVWVGSVHWYNTFGGPIKFEDMLGSYEDLTGPLIGNSEVSKGHTFKDVHCAIV